MKRDQEATRRRIRALLDLGRPAAAVTEALGALAQDPNDPEVLELLGGCRIRLGEGAEAVRCLRDAVAQAPERPHAHYLLGFALRTTGDLAGALAEFREALRLEPEEPVYLRITAELLADRKVFEEALALAARAVAAGPDHASNHVTFGFVASAAGRVDLAHAEYRKAVELDPNDATAWNNLGCIEMVRGDKLSARERFREALRLDPGAERAQRNLALVSPAVRPSAMYDDFDALLGEALRELRDAGRLPASLSGLAIAQAFGVRALQSALTGRAQAASAASRVGVAAGAAAASALWALVGRRAMLPATVAAAGVGIGWLATARKVAPLRRRHEVHVGAARREWDRTRAAWLDRRLNRTARDREIERILERLCLAVDGEPRNGGE
jgi:Flp pilus assembly protein TadD